MGFLSNFHISNIIIVLSIFLFIMFFIEWKYKIRIKPSEELSQLQFLVLLFFIVICLFAFIAEVNEDNIRRMGRERGPSNHIYKPLKVAIWLGLITFSHYFNLWWIWEKPFFKKETQNQIDKFEIYWSRICYHITTIIIVFCILSEIGLMISVDWKKSFELAFTTHKGYVKIGEQTWMLKNLDVDTFRNGEKIFHAKTDSQWLQAAKEKQPAWCYFNNNSNNGSKCGRLYNFYAISNWRGLAPEGWHIPEYSELETLKTFLGQSRKMKLKNEWKNNMMETNESAFSAVPSGLRDTDGKFLLNGLNRDNGPFLGIWSATESDYDVWIKYDDYAWILYLESNNDNIEMTREQKNIGLPVRCIKN